VLAIKIKTSTLDINLELANNETIYQLLVQKKFCKPFVKNMWCRNLAVPGSIGYWKCVYDYIFTEIDDTKLKEFRAKLVYNILPCKELLYKWKILDTPHCNACGTLETYEHFFIKCECLHSFWLKVGRVLEQTGLYH
jgi:hypothetical protein